MGLARTWWGLLGLAETVSGSMELVWNRFAEDVLGLLELAGGGWSLLGFTGADPGCMGLAFDQKVVGVCYCLAQMRLVGACLSLLGLAQAGWGCLDLPRSGLFLLVLRLDVTDCVWLGHAGGKMRCMCGCVTSMVVMLLAYLEVWSRQR